MSGLEAEHPRAIGPSSSSSSSARDFLLSDPFIMPSIPGLESLPLHQYTDGKQHLFHELFVRFSEDVELPDGTVITAGYQSGNVRYQISYCRMEVMAEMESRGCTTVEQCLRYIKPLRLGNKSHRMSHFSKCTHLSQLERDAILSRNNHSHTSLTERQIRTIIDEIVAAPTKQAATVLLSSFKAKVAKHEYQAGERSLLDLVHYWKIQLPEGGIRQNGSMEKEALIAVIVHACRTPALLAKMQPAITLPDAEAVWTFLHDVNGLDSQAGVRKLLEAVAFQPKQGSVLVGYGLKRIGSAVSNDHPDRPTRRDNAATHVKKLVKLIWNHNSNKDIAPLFKNLPPSKTSSSSKPLASTKRDVLQDRKVVVEISKPIFASRKPTPNLLHQPPANSDSPILGGKLDESDGEALGRGGGLLKGASPMRRKDLTKNTLGGSSPLWMQRKDDTMNTFGAGLSLDGVSPLWMQQKDDTMNTFGAGLSLGGGSPPWPTLTDDEDSDDNSDQVMDEGSDDVTVYEEYNIYEEYGETEMFSVGRSRPWAEGYWEDQRDDDEYASSDEEMESSSNEGRWSDMDEGMDFENDEDDASGVSSPANEEVNGEDEDEEMGTVTASRCVLSKNLNGVRNKAILDLISQIRDRLPLSPPLLKITTVFAEYVVEAGLTFSLDDIIPALQSLPEDALRGMLDLEDALHGLPMDQAWSRMFNDGDGRAPTVYDAFILIAEDAVKDLRKKIANFDPNDRDYEYIQSLSLKTSVRLGNQRFRIVAGYSGITTQGVDGRTKTTKSTVGGRMATLLTLVGLKGRTRMKVFSNSEPYAALQLVSSNRNHIVSQIIRLPTFPTPGRITTRYHRIGSVLECIAIATMQAKGGQRSVTAFGVYGGTKFAIANAAPGGDPVIYDCGDEVRVIAEGASKGLRNVHYIFSAPQHVRRSTNPEDPFEGPNMAMLRGLQSSILSNSAFPSHAWSEPLKSLRVIDVDADCEIDPFEQTLIPFDMPTMVAAGKRIVEKQMERGGGHIVLGIMSQKVARSLPAFRKMGLVEFRQAYAAHLNQTWVGDFSDKLLGIPMTLMQEPVRSQHLGSLKSAQVAAAKGLAMLMLSSNLVDKSAHGLAKFKAQPDIAKFLRSLTVSTNVFQREIREHISLNADMVITSLPATVRLRPGMTTFLTQSGDHHDPVVPAQFPAPGGFEGYVEVEIQPHQFIDTAMVLKIVSIENAWPSAIDGGEERFYSIFSLKTGYVMNAVGSGSIYTIDARSRGDGFTIRPFLPLIDAARMQLHTAPPVKLGVGELYLRS